MFNHINVFIFPWMLFISINGINIHEENLMKMLFGRTSQYNALITPIANASEPLDVYFGVTLSQIINVYEKEQIVKVNVWLQLRWYDYQMKWNPDRFGRLESIRVPPETWDLSSNADGNYEVSYKSNAVISADGSILWIPPAIFKLTCTMNVEYFPFDKQTCELRFASSGLSAAQVRFGWYATENSMELSDYQPSSTWELIGAPAEIRRIQSTEPPYQSRSEMVFFMIIQRGSLFYTINLILPTMMISALTITLFCLPSDAAEKMTLCTSILVALVFFMLLISKILPSTSSSIPLISKYLMFTFLMNLLTVFLSASSLYINHRRQSRFTPVPHWMRVIFLRALPACLFLNKPYENIPTRPRRLSSISSPMLVRKMKFNRVKLPKEMDYFLDEFLQSSDHIKYLSKKIQNDREELKIDNDWKYISLVIDRIQLLFFLIITFVGTLTMFLQVPKASEPHRYPK